MSGDIITAAATAFGEAAIGIVRISGEGSVALADELFEGRRPLFLCPARRMELGQIRGADTVLAVRFERGASYTGEESVELHCHGGSAAVSRVLELLIERGARHALPGEFTKRAFLSGRIDLAQAEAVLGVIQAAGADALAASRRAMQGELSSRLRELMDAITNARAEIEASLDYPEEVDGVGMTHLLERTADLASELSSRCRVGAALREGVRVAAAGAPNAGKSSLLNAIFGEERSIVTDMPGTTRDCVESRTIWRGMPMTYVDTAGIRPESEADAEAERIGIARARAEAERSDAVVFVADSTDMVPSVRAASELFRGAGTRRIYVVLNKMDLPQTRSQSDLTDMIEGAAGQRAVCVIAASAVRGDGVCELQDAIWRDAAGGRELSESYAVTHRALAAIEGCRDLAREAVTAYAQTDDASLAGSLLGEAAERLAAVLGTHAGEELLDAVFAGFCVGK